MASISTQQYNEDEQVVLKGDPVVLLLGLGLDGARIL
jgi:hypothetical protein